MKKTILIAFSLFLIAATLVSAFAVAESEPNDQNDTANVISPGVEYTGSISDRNDRDTYKITTTEDGYINFTFDHEVFDDSSNYWRVGIFNDTGTVVDGTGKMYNVQGKTTLKSASYGVKAGTYFVLVIPYYGSVSTQTYTLKVDFTPSKVWESEDNNTKNNADTIDVNTTYTGTHTADGDVDWYKFTTTEDGYFNMDFTHELFDSSNNYWEARLYDETGVYFIDGAGTVWGWSGKTADPTPYYGIKAGTYYIKISETRHTDINYQIKINFTPSKTWETENNNDKNSADEIEIKKVYTGAITNRNDVDWYKFTVTSEQKLAVRFTHEPSESTRKNWELTLYNSDAVNKLTTISINDKESKKTTDYVNLKPGTYYVKVSDSSYYSTANYNFEIIDWHECEGPLVVTEKPTCYYSGKEEKICTTCGKTFHSATVEALGHDFAKWDVNKQSTCSSSGSYVSKCTRCDYTSYKTMEKLPHEYGDWIVTDEATCTSYGSQHHICKNCERKEYDEILPLGHDMLEWAVAEKADCYHEGIEEEKCSRCDYKNSRKLEKTTHEFTEWERTGGNIIIQPIEMSQRCVHCNDILVREDWSLIWVDIVLVVLIIAGAILAVYFFVIKKKKTNTPPQAPYDPNAVNHQNNYQDNNNNNNGY